MRRSKRPIVIASRRSKLARAQAESVGRMLLLINPGIPVEYQWLESEGDLNLTSALADSGGKGLFAKEIERAVLEGKADLAIHSLKDLTTDPTPGLTLAAIPAREDARDCLIAKPGITSVQDLAQAAVLGTASPRRAAQLKRLRPDLVIKLMRGNIETRLKKIIDPDPSWPVEMRYDATLLAVAGLNRAGLGQHASIPLDPDIMLPAACQGALAIQCRVDDHVSLSRCLPLNNAQTATCVHAERGVVAGLGASCHSAVAVYATESTIGYAIRARVLSSDGTRCIEASGDSTVKHLGKLVKQIVASLKDQGAESILKS